MTGKIIPYVCIAALFVVQFTTRKYEVSNSSNIEQIAKKVDSLGLLIQEMSVTIRQMKEKATLPANSTNDTVQRAVSSEVAVPVKKESLNLSLGEVRTSMQMHNDKTSIGIIDILTALLKRYHNHRNIRRGDTLVVDGKTLDVVYDSIRSEYGDDNTIVSTLAALKLWKDSSCFIFSAKMSEPGTQPIPQGFGVKVSYSNVVNGRVYITLNSDRNIKTPHIFVRFDSTNNLSLHSTFLSPIKGIRDMHIVAAEVVEKERLIGILYGYRKDGELSAVRTDLRKPSAIFAKGAKISRKFFDSKIKSPSTECGIMVN